MGEFQSETGINSNNMERIRFTINDEFMRNSFGHLRDLVHSWSFNNLYHQYNQIQKFEEFFRKAKNWFDQSKIKVYTMITADILYKILETVSGLKCSTSHQKNLLINV